MSEDKKSGKKKIVTTAGKKKKASPARPKRGRRAVKEKEPMLFGKENFKWMLAGVGLIAIGLFFMMGGSMPSPDVWDESIIYSHRRITIGPFFILAGLILQFFAIFRKK